MFLTNLALLPMTRDIIDINDFTILVEASTAKVPAIDSCTFDEAVIAVAFYGSGNVDLTVKYGKSKNTLVTPRVWHCPFMPMTG